MKNKRISTARKSSYRQGKSKRKKNWALVSRISKEEIALAPMLAALGFVQQHILVTGVTGYSGLPRCFYLDFADVRQKLCVEIDGSAHRHYVERDARRDKMLQERGWRTLRIAAVEVQNDAQAVTEKITAWAISTS